jgi:hypothetical protein
MFQIGRLIFPGMFLDKGIQAFPIPYAMLELMTKIKIIPQPLAVK